MADPVSIAGLILAIPPIVEILVTYCSDVKNAKKDAQHYITELLSLRGVLEHIERQNDDENDSEEDTASDVDYTSSDHASAEDKSVSQKETDSALKFDSEPFLEMLRATMDLLNALELELTPAKSSVKSAWRRIKWSHKKKRVEEKINQLERAKSWFILVLTNENVTSSKDILAEIAEIGRVMEVERDDRKAEVARKKTAALLEWLAPIGPHSSHASATASHHSGTNDWFIDGPLAEFIASSHDSPRILWLQGKSGSGKTTLLAQAIEKLSAHVSTRGNAGLAYFYCSFDNIASHDPANVLGSLIAQLSSAIPVVLDDFRNEYEQSLEKKQPRNLTVTALLKIMIKHATKLDSLFICIDAVNESDQYQEVTESLLTLAAFCPCLKVIGTSTSGRSTEVYSHLPVIDIHMQPAVINEDIMLYIDSKLAEEKTFQNISSTLRYEIKDAILQRSDGMFRYAEMQIKHLSKQLTGRDIRMALADMPEDLNVVYERILKTIATTPAYLKYMRQALRWLAFARRPLSLTELSEAIVIEDDDDGIDQDCRLQCPEILLNLGQGLLEYSNDSNQVSLAHSSVKAFLTSESICKSDVRSFALDDVADSKMILRKCLVYLRFKAFGGLSCGHPEDRSTAAIQHPLLTYAAHNWPFHAKYVDEEMWSFIESFFDTRQDPDLGNYGFWITFVIGRLPPPIIRDSHPLYYAASLGYSDIVKAILKYGRPNLEQHGGRAGSTALQVACFRKQLIAAKLLVYAGANPLSLDGSDLGGGQSSLFWAEMNGWDEIVMLMRESIILRGFQEDLPTEPSNLNHPDVALMLQKRALDREEPARRAGSERSAYPGFQGRGKMEVNTYHVSKYSSLTDSEDDHLAVSGLRKYRSSGTRNLKLWPRNELPPKITMHEE